MTRATRLTVRGRRRLLAGSEFPADLRRVVSAYHRIDRLFHRDAGDPHSVGHRDLDLLERLEAACEVQRHTGKRGQQGELPEALAPGSSLALLDDAPAEATSRPIGANEHGPHLCRLGGGIEGPAVALGLAAARVEPAAPAPAAAGDELAVAFEHEVGGVGEEHPIDLRDIADGAR